MIMKKPTIVIIIVLAIASGAAGYTTHHLIIEPQAAAEWTTWRVAPELYMTTIHEWSAWWAAHILDRDGTVQAAERAIIIEQAAERAAAAHEGAPIGNKQAEVEQAAERAAAEPAAAHAGGTAQEAMPNTAGSKQRFPFHALLWEEEYINGVHERTFNIAAGRYEFKFVPNGDSPRVMSISMEGNSFSFADDFTLSGTLHRSPISEYYTWEYHGQKIFEVPDDQSVDIAIDPNGDVIGTVSVMIGAAAPWATSEPQVVPEPQAAGGPIEQITYAIAKHRIDTATERIDNAARQIRLEIAIVAGYMQYNAPAIPMPFMELAADINDLPVNDNTAHGTERLADALERMLENIKRTKEAIKQAQDYANILENDPEIRAKMTYPFMTDEARQKMNEAMQPTQSAQATAFEARMKATQERAEAAQESLKAIKTATAMAELAEAQADIFSIIADVAEERIDKFTEAIDFIKNQ